MLAVLGARWCQVLGAIWPAQQLRHRLWIERPWYRGYLDFSTDTTMVRAERLEGIALMIHVVRILVVLLMVFLGCIIL